MLVARFLGLERGDAGEDGLPLLDRADPSRGEAAAIAHAIDVVHHRLVRVTGTQEIAVQRMHMALRRHRLAGSGDHLAEHLPAEQLGKAEVLAGATEQVFLDAFQGQQIDQGVEYLGHFGILDKGGRTGAPCYGFRRQRSSNRAYCRQSPRSSR